MFGFELVVRPVSANPYRVCNGYLMPLRIAAMSLVSIFLSVEISAYLRRTGSSLASHASASRLTCSAQSACPAGRVEPSSALHFVVSSS